jgi:Spy/CpxP family protein refolding chaperone
MKTLVMLVITIVLITFCTAGITNAQGMGQKSGRAPGKAMMGMMQHKNDIFKKLKLTDEQKGKIKDLSTSFQKNMVDLRADVKKNMIDLKALKSKDNISRDEVIAAVNKINKSRDAVSLAVANHIYDIYQVLTPEQRKIAKEDFQGMGMRKWGRHARGCMNFDGGQF